VETVLRIGLSNAVIGAALAILAAGAGRILRRPAAAHLLWVLVLIKLLTPPLWNLPVRFPSAPAPASHQIPVEISAAQDHFVASAVRHEDPSAEPVSPINRITRFAVGLWGLGSLTCLLVAALRLRQFREVLSVATAAPDDLQRQTRNLASRLGMRRCPSVWLVPGRICPMVFAGLDRPRLLLPMDLCHRLTQDQQSTLLLHELAHLRRGDHLIRLLELAATIAYWWNPIVWWARHELRKAEEQCCDAWVTWTMPAEAHQYASALVDAIDFACESIPRFGPRLPLLASGIGEFGHLKRRLVMILQCNGNRKIGWSGLACACALAALLPFSLTRAEDASPSGKAQSPAANAKSDEAPATQPGKEKKADPALLAKLNRELPDVSFDGVGLSDVMDFLHDVSRARIEVDWKALEQAGVGRNTPVTAKFHNIKFSKLLYVLLDSVTPKKGKLVYELDKDVIHITAVEKKDTVDPALLARLNRELPEVKFTRVGLSDVIDFLHDVSGARIEVDWKALKQAGVDPNTPVTAHYRNVKFSKALHDLLESVSTKKGKVVYQPDQNTIMISVAQKGTLELRVYHLRNLPGQPDGKAKVQALIKKITDSVDPGSWGKDDGKSVAFDDTTGSILVTQTHENMDAVMKLIEQSDRGK
jgi:beta-lactamase regulating signal transducer with metallopeptidase domain